MPANSPLRPVLGTKRKNPRTDTVGLPGSRHKAPREKSPPEPTWQELLALEIEKFWKRHPDEFGPTGPNVWFGR